MKLARLIVILALSGLCAAATGVPQAKNILYYIDDTRNVCRVSLDALGKPLGKSAKLTSGGSYDGFSVSPDEKRMVGFVAMKRELDRDTGDYSITWKCFTEEPAKKNSRRMIGMMSPLAYVPSVYWSPRNTYFMVRYGYTSLKTDVYQFATGRKVVGDSAMPATISPDERYLVTESKYPLKPSGTKVIDLITDKSVEICERMCATIWVDGTRRLAWIDSGNVYVGEMIDNGKDLAASAPKKLSSGSYDLRYVQGKGLYFLMGDSRSKEIGCYSSDLQTITQGEIIPEMPDRWQAAATVKQKKNILPEDAVYSPDSSFIACSVKLPSAKKTQILVLDDSGHWSVVAVGRAPQWKGPDNIWNPWQQLW